MILSQSIGRFFTAGFKAKEMVDIMADAGFTGLDFSFFNSYDTEGMEDKEFLLYLRNIANDRGLVFNQAHAPFPLDKDEPEEHKGYFERVSNAIGKAAILGVKTIVVHPNQHLKYIDDGNPERLFEYNTNMFKRLQPYAEEYGVKIALENMYQRGDGINIGRSICSTPETFIQYLDALDKNWFTACLDIGHAQLVGESIPEFVKALGAERLTALHVHDVMPNADLHIAPFNFVGTIDYDAFCAALKDIGYKGDFTFESGNDYTRMPKELYPSATKLLADIGKYLIGIIEG